MDLYILQLIDQFSDYETQWSLRQVCHDWSVSLEPIKLVGCWGTTPKPLSVVLTQSIKEIAQRACVCGWDRLLTHAIHLGFDEYETGLYDASYGGHMSMVQRMIDLGAHDLDNGLGMACLGGHVEIVQKMIDLGSSAFEIGLSHACMGGHHALIQRMIRLGAHKWSRALHGACVGGHLDIVKLIIQHNMDEMTAHGGLPLDWDQGLYGACLGGHVSVVQMMLDHGANDLESGFYFACEGGHLPIIQMLIQNGTNQWNMGLAGACYGGHRPIVELLITYGADQWNRGLFWACNGDHLDLMQMMSEHGADQYTQCLHVVKSDAVIQWLIQHGINPENALVETCRIGSINTLKLWNKHGAENCSAGLENALVHGDLTIIEYLFQHGADPNQGLTLACQLHRPEWLPFLRQHGATTCQLCHLSIDDHNHN